MVRRIVIFLFIVCMGISFAWSQKMMIIQKSGKVSKTVIKPGNTIKFSLRGSHVVYEKTIQSFEDSTIIFANYNRVHIDEFSMIKAPLHPRIVMYSEWLIAGGSILFLADQVNNSIVNDEPFSLDRGVSIVSSSMIGTGIMLRFVKKRKFRFPGPYKIKLI